jgi:superoxide dismutase, Fe-Mn family
MKGVLPFATFGLLVWSFYGALRAESSARSRVGQKDSVEAAAVAQSSDPHQRHGHRQLQSESSLTLQLINSDTDLAIVENLALESDLIVAVDEIPGMIIPAFNVNATFESSETEETESEDTIRSVEFVYSSKSDNGDTFKRTYVENSPPFALCGNNMSNRSDYQRCRNRRVLGYGQHTIRATAYSQKRAQGRKVGPTIEATFTIVPTKATEYKLPDLPYAYNALEPYIDEATMRLHHDKHHGTAVMNLNKATNDTKQPFKLPLLELLRNALDVTPIRQNGGSHYNHGLFWTIMAPFDTANQTRPSPQLQTLIDASFNDTATLKALFSTAATPANLFGSGWVWLCVEPKRRGGRGRRRGLRRRHRRAQENDQENLDNYRLTIVGTPNQDNPLMRGVTKQTQWPILGLDVWEHAHYLKYKNVRADYVAAWWNIVNWQKVSENCAQVIRTQAGVFVPP